MEKNFLEKTDGLAALSIMREESIIFFLDQPILNVRSNKSCTSYTKLFIQWVIQISQISLDIDIAVSHIFYFNPDYIIHREKKPKHPKNG